MKGRWTDAEAAQLEGDLARRVCTSHLLGRDKALVLRTHMLPGSTAFTVDAYGKKNVLRVEVASRDVAKLAAELCGALSEKTTGAQVPVDGGNDRVI